MARMFDFLHLGFVAEALLLLAPAAQAAAPSCPVTFAQLQQAVRMADAVDKSGFDNHFWAVAVNRGGVVCAVAFSGASVGAQWLGSRQIAAAKAFTANAFSLPLGGGTGTTALSTAQLYQFVQPSNSSVANPLFGLDGGNVMDATVAYAGDFTTFGTASDPLIGTRMGGTITFGGGLALYSGNAVVGGVGVSGDTACADHSIAWRMRAKLGFEPANPTDQLPFATNATMTNGHPHCPNDKFTVGAKSAS